MSQASHACVSGLCSRQASLLTSDAALGSVFRVLLSVLCLVFLASCPCRVRAVVPENDVYLSPTALAPSPDGRRLFIACATGNQVLEFDTATGTILRILSPAPSPLGLVLSSDGRTLYVTCAGPASQLLVFDTDSGKAEASIRLGHTAMAPVLSPDEKTLFVCQRFNNEVAFVDLARLTVVQRVAVPREPVSAAVTSDGKHLLVVNHLHAGASNADYVAATVSVIDISTATVTQQLLLPNGSGMLREVRVSPDGKYACVTHLISRYHLPTTQIDRGWINSNALTLISLSELKVLNTVLLDNVDRGAANPWAIAWSADSKTILVTHAGTHELSLIRLPSLLAKLEKLSTPATVLGKPDSISASRTAADVPNDLAFLLGMRERVRLPESDLGPRATVVMRDRVYTANYFSDTLSEVDLAATPAKVTSISLNRPKPMDQIRRGEFLFNDATICLQGWQSCASCHSSDARVDGLNWDNLNDGVGNPKNVKSLLLAHQTPPSMSMGVREDASQAVRAGIRHTLFTVQPEQVGEALDAYLQSLQPIPSPHLVQGELSPAAERGKALFMSDRVGCARCHKPPLFTNLMAYDVGTAGRFDKPADQFDTPSLIELWRTAPYLHDGRAASVREAKTHWNPKDQRGATSQLGPGEIEDLVAYLLSL